MSTKCMRAGNIAVMLLALIMYSCSSKQPEVCFARLEQVIFTTPAADLQSALINQQELFETPLLNVDPYNKHYMMMLRDFASDTSMRYIFHVCDSLYHDLGWLEKELRSALGHADGVECNRFFTFVSGDFEDYSRRTLCFDNELAISLDHYAVAELHAGVPAYIERVSNREYMAADCMAAIARANIAMPVRESDMTLLDFAIAEGKVLYFLEKTMPRTPDTIRLRYTADQLRWMEQHTEQVWATLLKDGLLYSTDYAQFHNLIDEAPKTNAFGEGSAPRTPSYIGWRIVRQYMKKSGATMQQLFSETDGQQILSKSGWRP